MSELYHFGIKGMRWGIRRTPEQLGHRPTKAQKKERKRLTKDLAAAQQNLKTKTKVTQSARELGAGADSTYEKAIKRSAILYGGKGNKEKAVISASERFDKLYKIMEFPESRKLKAEDIYKEKRKALVDYVDALTKEYGSENVKQLKTKTIYAGKKFMVSKRDRLPELYVNDMIKTGFRVENVPIIGSWATGKKVSAWEKKQREELLAKRSRAAYKNRYS